MNTLEKDIEEYKALIANLKPFLKQQQIRTLVNIESRLSAETTSAGITLQSKKLTHQQRKQKYL